MIRVLHVDDDKEFLKLSKRFMSRVQDHIELVPAKNVHQALEKLENEHFDAILSDFKMNSMTGLDLLKHIRSNGFSLPFIIFTGKSREEVAIKALNLGADYYLRKDGDFTSLFTDLAHILKQSVELRVAGEALGDRVKMLQVLFDKAPTPVFLVDEEGHYVDANPAALEFIECEYQDLLMKEIWDFTPPSKLEQHKKELDPFFEERTLEIDYLINGKVKTLLLNFVPLELSGKKLLYGIGIDLTDRRYDECS